MKDQIISELKQSALVLNKFLSDPLKIKAIEEAGSAMAAAIKNGNKIISCGNGGSHCDAIHFAEELTGKYREEREAIAAVAISDVAHLSCTANDYGFEHVFSRFVQGLGNEGDVLLGISTSGNSENVIKAFEVAKQKKITTVALTGNSGGGLSGLADFEVRVDHFEYADRIQEIHIKVIHIFIYIIEKLTINNAR